MVLANNDYLMNFGNDFLIDGNFDAPLSALSYQSCLQRVSVSERLQFQENSLALGQLINHSPNRANLVPYEYTFKSDFPAEFRPFIPTVYFSNSRKANDEALAY
jgi:hypothetical protein